jgi:methylated-DNA-[protein]-cysteine S-methyltransferase
MEKYFIYKCKKGDIRIDYSDKGVTGVLLPYDLEREAGSREYLENKEIRKYFDDYFAGKEPEPLKLSIKVTEFQRKVFDILLNTKRGTYLTYGDVARLIHCGSNQAIGQALKRNPVPIIIACHRVVGKGWDGGFGGEITGEKMEFKKFLLDQEK